MLIAFLAKEIKSHLMTFRFMAALLVTFLLIVLSVWVLGNDFVLRNQLYVKLSESYAEQSDDVYVPSQFSPMMHKPPTPMSIFAQGKEKRLGNAVVFSRWSVPSDAIDQLTNNKLTADRLSYDLMTIFILIISLFSLLITYDAFSGERETGTLRLLCSFGLSRASIFTIKFIAGFVVISLPFLLSFVSALLVLQFVHAIAFTGAQWLAIALIVFACLIYCAVFIVIGLVCSAVSNRSSASLVLALFIWALAVILIPALGNSMAKFFAPLLPPEEIEQLELQTAAELKVILAKYMEEETPRIGGSWQGAYILDEKVSLFDTFSVAGYNDILQYARYQERLKQERAERIWNAKRNHVVREKEQAELAAILSSISPAFQLRDVFTRLSGTGFKEYDIFLDGCRRYRQAVLQDFRRRGYFDRNIHDLFMRLPKEYFSSDEVIRKRWDDYLARRDSGVPLQDILTWERSYQPLREDLFPHFQYRGAQPDFNAALWPIGLLSLMAAVIFFIGFAVFIRYDVR